MVTLHTLTKKVNEVIEGCYYNPENNDTVTKKFGLEERWYQFDDLSIKVDSNIITTTGKEEDKKELKYFDTKTFLIVNCIGVLEQESLQHEIISDFVNDAMKYINNRNKKHDILIEIKDTKREKVIAFKLSSAIDTGPRYINFATLVWRDDLPKLSEAKIVALPDTFDATGVPYEVMRNSILDKISLQGGTVDCPLIFKTHSMVEEEKEYLVYTNPYATSTPRLDPLQDSENRIYVKVDIE